MADDLIPYDPDEVASQIYHLRKAGKSFSEIYPDYSSFLTYDHMVALYRSYSKKLAHYISADDRQQSLHLELDRLDALQSAVWPMAISGDRQAVETILKIMAQRSRYLGLDQLSATDQQQVANILVVGGDQRAFVEALEHGRDLITMAGETQDDEDDQEVS